MWEGPFVGTKYEDPLWYLENPNYDSERADRAVHFFQEYLTHTKGRWGGQRFYLLPWQEHQVIRPLYGIINPDTGLRQFRVCYICIPKKNGKSEIAAGVALELLGADGEAGPEVYSAACDKIQASLVFDVAKQMVRQDQRLHRKLKIVDSTKRIMAPSSAGFYRVLSSDVKTKHGINAHGVIFDELHAQPNDRLWKVLTKGSMDARSQPILFVITTAGGEDSTVWKEEHDYCEQILNGTVDNPEVLPVIYSLPLEEDWEDEENWKKANPSMGDGPEHIFNIDRMRAMFIEAKEKPSEVNMFRRLRLNQCLSDATKFIDMDKWRHPGGPVDYGELKGRKCYGGLDLSSTTDLSAYWLVFPFEDGSVKTIGWAWCPAKQLEKRAKQDNVPYDQFARDGWLIPTTTNGGETIDYQAIELKVMESAAEYNIQEIMYDRYNSTYIIQNLLKEGLTMVDMGQGFVSMNAPTKYLEVLYLEKQLHHGNNPLLNWCASNLVIDMDAAGNIKPTKSKSTQRIDPMVALIEALDGYRRRVEVKKDSVYESRGVREVG